MSKVAPRISLVTISLNQASFLSDCIESVLQQGYPNLEYIVVDPGSTDGSREIVARFADNISTVIFEPDNGPADGLNKGFKHATGDVFGYLNADDLLLPGALWRVAEWFTKQPTADVIYGNGLLIDAQGKPLRRLFSTRWSLGAYIYDACNIPQQSTFIRSDAFRRAGGFNALNRTCWDGELLVDLARSGATFERRFDAIGAFRTHADSITSSGRLSAEKVSDSDRIFRKVRGRHRTPTDILVRWGYRSWKLISHPVVTCKKLHDRITLGPP